MNRVCTRCVMDTSDRHIWFDDEGVCNHCHGYEKNVSSLRIEEDEKEKLFLKFVHEIKKQGKGKKYDCITGLSGGADSSYVIYIAKKYGLNPLVVHLDNGWNDPLATNNINKIIEMTGFDILNVQIEKSEFIDIQRAYFEASVVDVEVPTDMAIISIINQMALKYKINYILSGVNYETEYTMGKDWNFNKLDRANFNRIYEKFGHKKLQTFPYFSPYQQFLLRVKNVRTINVLQYTTCDYNIIKATLVEAFNWSDYPIKHGESIFTAFYQSYYLPLKFGIDKRKAHLSDQIRAGIIDREKAVKILKNQAYSTDIEKEEKYNQIIHILGYSDEEFQQIMKTPTRAHTDFSFGGSSSSLIDKFFSILLENRLIMRVLKKIHKLIFN